MWLKKIKQKKTQYLLVALILFITAAIFSTCFSFTMESAALVDKTYKKGSYPDCTITATGAEAQQEIEAAAEKSDSLKITSSMDFFWLDGKMTFQGQNITDLMTGIRKLEKQEDLFSLIELTKATDWNASAPGDDEVWLSKVFCDAKGIELGDTIFLDYYNKELTLTGIFKTTECPSAVANSLYPIYINANTFSEIHPSRSGKIYAFDEAEDKDVISLLKETIGTDYQKISPAILQFTSKAQMSAASMQVSGLLGGLGTLAGIIVFFVATIIIQFIIRANLLKEYKSIGTYKALGFSNKKIRGIYAKSYAFTGAIAVTLGTLAAIPLSAVMGANINSNMIGYELTTVTAAISVVTILLLNTILILSAVRGTKKVKKIYPVDAFRIGISSSKQKIRKSFIPCAHSPLAVAVNDIVRKGRMSIMTVIVLSLSLFITVLIFGFNYSCREMTNHMDSWFCIPTGDIYASGSLDKDTLSLIEKDDRVSYSCYGTYVSPPSMSFDKKYKISEQMESSLFFSSRSNASPESGMQCNIGRMPDSDSEIAIAKAVLNELGLSVGDYVDFYGKEKNKLTYLITGEFSTMMGSGRLVLFTQKELEARGDKVPVDFSSIQLKPGTDKDIFIKDMEAASPNIIFDTKLQMVDDIAKGIVDMTGPMSAVLILIMFLFSLLNIVNLVIMDNTDNRRSYGIMKALGFKTSYLMKKAVIRIAILTLLGMGISMGLYAALSGPIFKATLSVNSFIYDYPASIAIICSMLLLTIAATLISCLSVRTISPAELMEE